MPGPDSGPQLGTDAYVASVARGVASPDSREYEQLATVMCWTGVAHVLELAQIDVSKLVIRKETGKGMKVKVKHLLLVDSTNGTQLTSSSNVPEGSVMGFFSRGEMIHAMISLGGLKAAGTKNNCIGLGNPYGWEILDLSELDWNESENEEPSTSWSYEDGRPITAYYRSPVGAKGFGPVV